MSSAPLVSVVTAADGNVAGVITLQALLVSARQVCFKLHARDGQPGGDLGALLRFALAGADNLRPTWPGYGVLHGDPLSNQPRLVRLPDTMQLSEVVHGVIDIHGNYPLREELDTWVRAHSKTELVLADLAAAVAAARWFCEAPVTRPPSNHCDNPPTVTLKSVIEQLVLRVVPGAYRP